MAGTTVRLAADDPAGGFDVIGSDITPTGLVVSLLTRADLLPEQNVGATLIDRLPAGWADNLVTVAPAASLIGARTRTLGGRDGNEHRVSGGVTLTNTATVGAGAPDPDTGNNSASATSAVVK